MRDRLKEIKKARKEIEDIVGYVKGYVNVHEDLADKYDWMIAEIERLRANQIPGRCRGCAYWDRFDDSESVGNCLLEDDKCAWGAGDFCSSFKPKDSE